MIKSAAGIMAMGLICAGLSVPAFAGDKLGRIVIKAVPAESRGQQVLDAGIEDTVKDLKRRAGAFVVVDDVASADFLLLVVGREDTPMSGQQTAKRVTCTLSTKNGASWSPGVKITKVSTSWGLSSSHVLGEAKKWIKANSRKPL